MEREKTCQGLLHLILKVAFKLQEMAVSFLPIDH